MAAVVNMQVLISLSKLVMIEFYLRKNSIDIKFANNHFQSR